MSTPCLGVATAGIHEFWAPNKHTGFLPRCMPATPAELASSVFPSLRALGSVAAKLGGLSDAELVDFVASLPMEPDSIPFADSPDLCEAAIRAYVILAAHLIHRPSLRSRKELPANVALPLWSLSKCVGRPPSLTYASYVLANSIVPVLPRSSADVLRVAQTTTGSSEEAWFVAIHISVESAGGDVVQAIESIEKALDERDTSQLVAALESIASCMRFINEVVPRLRERLDPLVFRTDIRPLLYGHDQIRFTGVDGGPLVTYIGVTGAQSGVIRAADAVLGVRHSEAMNASMSPFMACASRAHQQFFERAAYVGRRLALSEHSTEIRDARQAALATLAEFRRVHLCVVSDYLASEKPATVPGTGGTNFSSWLQELIHETHAAASKP